MVKRGSPAGACSDCDLSSAGAAGAAGLEPESSDGHRSAACGALTRAATTSCRMSIGCGNCGSKLGKIPKQCVTNTAPAQFSPGSYPVNPNLLM